MNSTALTLILISAGMHAGWNLLGKRNTPSLAFFMLATTFGGVLLSPLLLIGQSIWTLPAAFWGWLLATGLCQMLYLGGLGWAYARGEISMLYPLARALPVILVPTITVGILRDQILDLQDWLGMGLILFGALCMPLASLSALRLKSYLTPALGFVLLAALGTTGYSLVDKQALSVMTAEGYSALNAGAHYMSLQTFSTFLWALPVILCLPGERRQLYRLCRQRRSTLAITGIMMVATYGLVLMALASTPQVSHVVALRQLSLPLGVLLGILWLKESASGLKIPGLVIMLGGLTLVAL